MNNNVNFFDWLDFENEDELVWAINYLTKKGLVDWNAYSYPTNKQVFYDVSKNLKSLRNPERTIVLINFMKAARNQRNYRKIQKKENQKKL